MSWFEIILLWGGWLVLVGVGLVGLVLNLLGLPGIWLIVLGTIVYGISSGWGEYVGWTSVLTLLGIGITAELIEFLAGAAGSRKFGGSKRGMVGAVVGGLVGGIAGTPIFPVVGTIAGSILGSFIGAFLVESGVLEKSSKSSAKVGIGAALGRALGIVIKSAFGAAMLLIAAITALPIDHINHIESAQPTTPIATDATPSQVESPASTISQAPTTPQATDIPATDAPSNR